MDKILIICTAHCNRSPSVHRWLEKHHPEFEVRSGGTWYDNADLMNEKDLKWADVIACADLSHAKFLKEHFPQYMEKVIVIGLSDEYDPDQPELIELIEFWFSDFLGKGR